MFVWLDDERPMPVGYTHHVKDAQSAIKLLETGLVEEISLDHDLGQGVETGYMVAKWIEEQAVAGKLKRFLVRLHTMNPVGKQNMKLALQKAHLAWIYPKCPECGNTMDNNDLPDGKINCANCKHRW